MMRTIMLIGLSALLAGCAMPVAPKDPLDTLRTGRGTAVWQNEYEFVPPEKPWQLLQLDEEDYSLAFFRGCQDEVPGSYPCESTFAYAEEPFGYSRNLEKRQAEFFRRFLWAARVDFEKPRLNRIRALGGEALEAETVGHERVLKHKVLTQVVFAHRGERVVAFYFTQWRSSAQDFDRDQLKAFKNFVDSFRFRRPSFYQLLLTSGDSGPAGGH